MWKFYGNAQFPQCFWQITRNSAETVRFQNISTSKNYVKVWCFTQCYKTDNSVKSPLKKITDLWLRRDNALGRSKIEHYITGGQYFVNEIFSTQFVIFKPLSYCFEETIGFDVKSSFVSRPVSRLIR